MRYEEKAEQTTLHVQKPAPQPSQSSRVCYGSGLGCLREVCFSRLFWNNGGRATAGQWHQVCALPLNFRVSGGCLGLQLQRAVTTSGGLLDSWFALASDPHQL